jgi:hypothetical protein
MNFMQWLNSLDELLYEVMSWIVFFPVTLWRALTRPLAMMNYADLELREKEDEQFTDTLSPPLFLVIALLLSHGVEMALGGGTNPIVTRTTGLGSLVSDNSTLLLLRLIVFSIFPLMFAVRLLRASKAPVTKLGLKPPFYAQCYAAGPFALFLGLGTSIAHTDHSWSLPLGPVVIIVTLIGYLAVQTRWFAEHLHKGLLSGLLHSVRALVMSAVLMLFTGFLFVGSA